MSIFSLAFWSNALEAAVVAGSAGFLAVIPATGTWNMNNLKAAGIAAATGALYAFIKQLGAVQAVNAVTKVAIGKHVARGRDGVFGPTNVSNGL